MKYDSMSPQLSFHIMYYIMVPKLRASQLIYVRVVLGLKSGTPEKLLCTELTIRCTIFRLVDPFRSTRVG